ncbi:MAG TPA: FtsX-like permease family protein [Bacteriovoracaceae bacterium]|nr:FtsX-like permease family protein [Bacteriovoracaceae bacterium]
MKFFIIKEIKKFPFFFLLLFFTVFLGTLGLLGIGLVTEQVRDRLRNNANELLTSDLAVTARREITASEIASIDRAFENIPHTSYQVIDIYSMVNSLKDNQSRLAEIRSYQEGYPYYGGLTFREGQLTEGGFYVSRDLADLWDIKLHDKLKIGVLSLSVDGIVENDSSLGLRGFSLAPRVYVPLSTLKESELLKPGATGSYAYHFKFNDYPLEKTADLKQKIYQTLTDPAIKIVLPEDTSEQTGRVINLISNFMSLSGLIGLILSLVGVFYLYQSHLLGRLKDLCLLNLYGLTKGWIIAGIVLQFTILFITVIAVDLVFILPGYKFFAPQLSQTLGLELSKDVELKAFLFQFPFLYVLSLSILVPLLFGLMRTSMGLQLKASKLSMGRFRFFDFLPFGFLLWIFSCYLGKSFKTGNLFFASLVLVFCLSTAVVLLLQWSIRRVTAGKGLLLPSIEYGIALRSLSRSGHKLTLSFLSLALGATLISLILQLDKKILGEFVLDDKKPSLFIFDIQEEQIDAFSDYARSAGTPLTGVTPMIRGRLEKVNGEKFMKEKNFNFRDLEEDEDARMRNNGLNMTYRMDLSPSEKLVEGTLFTPGASSAERPAGVSLEKRWAQRMGLSLGDELTFDVQGVEFEGVVQNIREVKWTSFYPNFFVTIEPGFIEAAPKTYLAVLPAGPRGRKLSFQKNSVAQFPNISFIDVEELITKLSDLFNKSQKAISVISWLSLAVGLVILYGLSHDQVFRRYYDLALMKSLGFSKKQLRLNLLLEFGTLFLSAMGLGFFLGWLLAQFIGKEIFKLPFSVEWSRVFIPAAALSVLCLATILLSSWRALNAKPRELLSDN